MSARDARAFDFENDFDITVSLHTPAGRAPGRVDEYRAMSGRRRRTFVDALSASVSLSGGLELGPKSQVVNFPKMWDSRNE